jgi:hypothetical protein
MDYLNKASVATVVFYDALGRALAIEEIHRFLINPSRLDPIPSGLGKIDIESVAAVLKKMVLGKQISKVGDFFTLPGREQLSEIRQ